MQLESDWLLAKLFWHQKQLSDLRWTQTLAELRSSAQRPALHTTLSVILGLKMQQQLVQWRSGPREGKVPIGGLSRHTVSEDNTCTLGGEKVWGSGVIRRAKCSYARMTGRFISQILPHFLDFDG
jgi:hypothetical protein